MDLPEGKLTPLGRANASHWRASTPASVLWATASERPRQDQPPTSPRTDSSATLATHPSMSLRTSLPTPLGTDCSTLLEEGRSADLPARRHYRRKRRDSV